MKIARDRKIAVDTRSNLLAMRKKQTIKSEANKTCIIRWKQHNHGDFPNADYQRIQNKYRLAFWAAFQRKFDRKYWRIWRQPSISLFLWIDLKREIFSRFSRLCFCLFFLRCLQTKNISYYQSDAMTNPHKPSTAFGVSSSLNFYNKQNKATQQKNANFQF